MANADVGKLWHVGLDDAGYMLRPQEGAEYRRATLRLDSAAQRTQSNQFIFDQYVSRRQRDWSGGAGQEHEGTDLSLPTRFYSTDGKIDPFTEKPKLVLARDWDEVSATASTPAYAGQVAKNDHGYWFPLDSSEEWVLLSEVDDSTPVDTTGLAAKFNNGTKDVTSDGALIYWVGQNNAGTAGSAVTLDNDPTTTPTDWATTLSAAVNSFVRIDYMGDRFAAVYDDGDMHWSTLDSNGDEEVAGGRLTYLGIGSYQGWTNTVLGNGYLWFGVDDQVAGPVLYSWQVGSADAPRVAAKLPPGTRWNDGSNPGYQFDYLFFSQGLLYVVCNNSNFDEEFTVFRGITDGGDYNFEILLSTGGYSPFHWVADSDKVILLGSQSLYLIDPSTGGWVQRDGPDTSGIGGGTLVNGRLLTVAGASSSGKFYYESTDYYSTGTLYGSFTDHGTLVPKAFDEIRALGVVPTGSDIDIAVGYGTDNESPTWTDLGDLNPSETEAVLPAPAALTADFPQWNYRVILHRGTTTTQTAELHAIELRHHIRGLSDEIIQLPIDCTDHIELANGSPHRGNGKGAGRARLAALRALVGTRVGFQDLDYLSSGSEEEVEVVSVDTAQVQIGERRPVGGQFPELIAVVTLRKVG